MAYATASKKKEDVKQGGSNHITRSGVYPVEILAGIVNVSPGGSESVDFFLNHQGQEQILYGNLRVTNNDGSPNKIGAKIFNQLLIIADLDTVADPVEAELPIGKNGKMKAVDVLEDLSDIKVWMRVQMEYSSYNGNIQEKKVIKSFFRAEDKATAEEIVNGSTPGAGFESEQKYVNNVTYKDGLTEEVIDQWIRDGRPQGTASDSTNTTPEKEPNFGKRRWGKSSSEAS